MRNKKQHAEYTRQWRLKNPEKVKEYEKNNKEKRKLNTFKSNLKRKYGITLNEYNDMLINQKNCCAICGKERLANENKFAVDHNHKTMEVRGLLCKKCNTGIGLFDENIETLMNAIEYLKPQGTI